jgi:hypothetical protein
MELTNFIAGLINEGRVKVVPGMLVAEPEDLRLAVVHLRQYYDDDTQEMPAQTPDFDQDAALWAARYLYASVQFILMRELDESFMQQYLMPYDGPLSPAAIYSADLTLRYLPDLFNLAKGLSPNDPLVVRLRATAFAWPFSAAAIPLEEDPELQMILEHPSLQRAYIDRILAVKDKQKCQHPACFPLVMEALGNYADVLWPQFEPDNNRD